MLIMNKKLKPMDVEIDIREKEVICGYTRFNLTDNQYG